MHWALAIRYHLYKADNLLVLWLTINTRGHSRYVDHTRKCVKLPTVEHWAGPRHREAYAMNGG